MEVLEEVKNLPSDVGGTEQNTSAAKPACSKKCGSVNWCYNSYYIAEQFVTMMSVISLGYIIKYLTKKFLHSEAAIAIVFTFIFLATIITMLVLASKVCERSSYL